MILILNLPFTIMNLLATLEKVLSIYIDPLYSLSLYIG